MTVSALVAGLKKNGKCKMHRYFLPYQPYSRFTYKLWIWSIFGTPILMMLTKDVEKGCWMYNVICHLCTGRLSFTCWSVCSHHDKVSCHTRLKQAAFNWNTIIHVLPKEIKMMISYLRNAILIIFHKTFYVGIAWTKLIFIKSWNGLKNGFIIWDIIDVYR